MAKEKVRQGRPKFTGVTTYRDEQGRFEFRYPWDWERSELDDDRDGVIIRPEVDDDDTYFAVWISRLEMAVVADDLPDLRAGFDAGLERLGSLEIESTSDDAYGNVVKLERIFTFDDDGEVRKRRAWGMYADTWQMVVIYQGSSVGEFKYWLPMGNYCFGTFNLPFALWFATDPTVKTPGAE